MIHEKSCGVIIYQGDKRRYYLLLKYGHGHWGFVKGKTEKDEKEIDTAVRETQEETGITKNKLLFAPNFKEKISYIYKKTGNTISKKVIFFLAKTQQHYIDLSDEHTEYAWLSYEDAIEKLTFQNSKNLLKKAHKKLTENMFFQ
jgi:8-oxo-dGTP pyrophosphatase MutT (NUDIX family)